MNEQPTPVTEDATATAAALLARAQADYAAAQTAAQQRQAHGGTEAREGVLPGNVR